MLKLKKISKSYITGDFKQDALKDVDLSFRKSEFVSILGPSGSGKTTLLNVIGGLDNYDSGDLIINNKSTKKFKDNDWDFYRNNCIGFIFQSYNLITHITVLENVEMGMTLSGVSSSQRKKKALELLDKVGLKDHAYKRPTQLSGGQMQRVAIARALCNDPDIILADEPTGALDTQTSIQIMELIKEISKDKLVIMVTHNPDLAKEYASRIIEFKDGKVVSDSNPIQKDEKASKYHIKKTAMSFLTALKLSFNNIKTKKGRTLLTAFASSIGIIGIALILSLSNGFDIQINKFESDTLSNFPIFVSTQAIELDEETMSQLKEEFTKNEGKYPDNKEIYPYDSSSSTKMHYNILTDKYVDYVNAIDKEDAMGISYIRLTSMNLLSKNKDVITPISSSTINFTSLPKTLNEERNFLEEGYDLLEGKMPEKDTDLVLVLDSKNRLEKSLLEALGLDSSKDALSFDEVLGKEIRLINNNDYYVEKNGYFMMNTDYDFMYDKGKSLTIVGIVRAKEESMLGTIMQTISASMGNNTVGSILYQNNLIEEYIKTNQDSAIVQKQESVSYNILSGQTFQTKEEKTQIVSYLGGSSVPVMISIYPTDFGAKDNILTYLEKYNEDIENEEDKIIYTDMAATMTSLSGSIMDAITIVLIAFSGISLLVSSIMIGIITYISVLERTKEIGILRALGARKKDVTRVFNAETFIIGICSGTIGLIIARLLIFPTNMILKNLTDLDNVAQLSIWHALLLLMVSIVLTMIGGFLPAIMASKKDPVDALRTE